MPGLTVCTANLDFAKKRRQHRLYLAYLIELCDVLFVQEAKRIRLRRLLPATWNTMQRVRTAATRGSAIAWRRPMVHDAARLRLGAMPATRVGRRVRVARMLPRWAAVVVTRIDGREVALISAHWPPLRYAWLWPQMDRRIVALIVEQVQAGRAVLLGADFNHLPAKVAERLNALLAPHGITVEAHGDGRIDGFLTVDLNVVGLKVDRYGVRHGLTDHPAVITGITITVKETP